MLFEREREVLEKLAKAHSAVKPKYHLIRHDKLEANKVIDESFEQLSELLQNLVK